MTQQQISEIKSLKRQKDFTTEFINKFDKEWNETVKRLKRGGNK